MCLLIGDRLAFAAPPKVGTTFVSEHCVQNGAVVRSYATGVHAVDTLYGQDRDTFTVVREPLSWLVSMYFHLRGRRVGSCRLPATVSLFNSAPHDRFDSYIDWVVARPNLLYFVFEPYISVSKYLLRNESLDQDLSDLLEEYGYEVSGSAGRVNATNKDRICFWTQDMMDDVRASQPYLFEVHGYGVAGCAGTARQAHDEFTKAH